MTELTVGRFRAIAERAFLDAGAGAATTDSLLDAMLSAERAGRPEVGIAHLPDYLSSLREGRIDGAARPEIESPLPAFKGGNVAPMVEMLSAGLAQANWSMDAGHFRSGGRRPGIGITVVSLRPPDPQAFAERAARSCARLREAGVRVPGSGAPAGPFDEADVIEVNADVLERLTG